MVLLFQLPRQEDSVKLPRYLTRRMPQDNGKREHIPVRQDVVTGEAVTEGMGIAGA